MLSVCLGVVERDNKMTSTITQQVEQSEDFTKVHVESLLRIFGYAGHYVCVGSTCWALLCKCTRLCWATHGWSPNKGNVEPCWAKSLTSFKSDSTKLNTAQHLSTGCSNRLNLLSSTCWELVQWTNLVHLHVAYVTSSRKWTDCAIVPTRPCGLRMLYFPDSWNEASKKRSEWDFSRLLIVMSVKFTLRDKLLKVNSALKLIISVIEDQCSGGQRSSNWGRQHFNTSSR